MKNHRHRKAMGVVLAARGFVYMSLESPERSVEDLTQCLVYLPAQRCATVYQLRAEVLERLGKLEEARRDEEKAAEIMENAEVVHPGMISPRRNGCCKKKKEEKVKKKKMGYFGMNKLNISFLNKTKKRRKNNVCPI